MAFYRTDCVEKPVSKLFEKLGHLVGSYPLWFFVVPLITSAALGGGLYFLKDGVNNDVEQQFTPINGPSKQAREFVKATFPSNDSLFSTQRLYAEGNYSVIIFSVTEGNILTDALFEEIRELDKQVHGLSVTVDQTQIRFKDLCARENGECVPNPILNVTDNKFANLSFPIKKWRGKDVFLGSTVGGVEESGGVIQRARAVKLFYFLQDINGTLEWLQQFQNFLFGKTFNKGLEVSYFTSLSRQEEIEKHTTDGIPLFSITYSLAISFSVLSCMRLDNVRNKIWVSFMGVLSAGLAVLSSFGLLLLLRVPFVITVANSPFLILGIGVDDMFIMLSNWQQTKVKDPVEKRMAETFKEAAMSITITTLTDVLGFYIGLMSEFRSVQAFCLYTSTSIIFCYVYNILFFGSALALNGRREQSNRHWLTCCKLPTQTPEGKSLAYRLCCVGGDYDQNTGAEKQQPIVRVFKSYYGPFLIKPWTKVCVMLIYLGYLAGGIYGCFNLKQGINMRDLASDSSYVIDYYDNDRKFFSRYGPNVMVAVTEELPYWNESSRSELNHCMEKLYSLTFVNQNLSKAVSWLDGYLQFAQNQRLNVNGENVFMENLSSFFLRYPEFKLDVNITEGKIGASRFFLQTLDIANASMEIAMFNDLRNAAQSCSAAKLLVFHPLFIYLDQYMVIVTGTIQNVGFTTAVMLVVSLLLIPNPLCSLWVTFSIGSVVTGVAGFMALWDVNLDSISMIILVVCIGFTVDFSAHISYAFVSSKKSTANERAVDALVSLGYPVLQGAASTIIGVLVLATSRNHIFRTFFKIMFLVMSFGLAHSIIFIPVFLTLLSCSSNETKKTTTKVPDVIPKIVMIENKSTAYDNYAFTKDSPHMCGQTVKTQSTDIYFIPNNKMPSSWCRDPDCP
ncbi:patched domain-containing protein 3-like [Puntigrus tetrazona]|uniref:patched domain-containing protein 3-like n=1 Tax=Puntigrus tetrazona TaxID=1606681 RepID=UPI001C8A8C4E|nr:patched domain-containing protein 3-like [Puntigrus tetrazona]